MQNICALPRRLFLNGRRAICLSSCAELIGRCFNEAGSGRKWWELCLFDRFKTMINVRACGGGGGRSVAVREKHKQW